MLSTFLHSSERNEKNCPTKRAPDAGDSAAISSSFLRLIIFLVGRLRRPHPAQVTQTVRWLTMNTNYVIGRNIKNIIKKG